MPGELWRGFTQLAKESSYGDGTQPATRRVYYDDPKFSIVRAPRRHMFATATRDNLRSLTVGPQEIGGELKLPLSSSEIIELLLMNLAGGVTPTQPDVGGNPSVYLWTFTTGTSLDSAAFEWHDGANPWVVSGVLCDRINIRGSANGPNDVTATMFGKAITETSMTGGLDERTPEVVEGWETTMFLDAFGGTPGDTQVSDFLINWDMTISAGLQRKYFANDQNSLGTVPIGVLGVEGTLTFEAANGQSITEFDNWNVTEASPTYRLLRLYFGGNANISGPYNRFLSIDVPCAWEAIDLGQTDAGTRVYQARFTYVFDPDNEFGVQVICQNDRATAWV